MIFNVLRSADVRRDFDRFSFEAEPNTLRGPDLRVERTTLPSPVGHFSSCFSYMRKFSWKNFSTLKFPIVIWGGLWSVKRAFQY